MASGSYKADLIFVTRYWPWTDLDIDPVNDERAVKRAYSSKLKALDPEKDAAGFIALRSAYDYALSLAKHGNAEYHPDDDYWDDEDDSDVSGETGGSAEAVIALPVQNEATTLPEDDLYQYRRNRDVLGEVDEAYEAALSKNEYDSDYGDEPGYDEPYQYAQPEYAEDYGVNGSDIAAALQELSALHQGRSKRIDENAVKTAFDKVTASPDLENIIIANRLESDLAMMVNNAGNKGFFLAELADFHFGWTNGAAQFGLEWPMLPAQQTAEASRFFRHIDQGTPRSERERLYIQALGWFEQGPQNWFSDLGRHKRVTELLETLQEKAPSVYYALDQNKIDAWENRSGNTGKIGWPMFNFMMFTTLSMTAFLDIESGAAGLYNLSAIWALASAAILAALMYRQPRITEIAYFQDHLPLPKREWGAFAGLMLLIPVALLGPVSAWSLVLLAATAAFALAQTTHPNLPKSDSFWAMIAERRYVIAANWIAMQAGFGGPQGYFLFLPTAAAAWAFTHAHPRFQASLDQWSNTVPGFRRWKLHAGILVIAAGLIALPILNAPTIANSWWSAFGGSATMRVSAILLLLCHDAVTGRYVAAPGMQFYIIRIFAGFCMLFSPVLALLALVILRTAGILYVAYRDARTAKSHGAEWNDRGDGFTGEGGGFSWGWIVGAIVAVNLLRILVQAS